MGLGVDELGVDVSVGLGVELSEMEVTLDAELPACESEMTDTSSNTSVKRVMLADTVSVQSLGKAKVKGVIWRLPSQKILRLIVN